MSTDPLPVGPELDAEIARRVMGLEVSIVGNFPLTFPRGAGDDVDGGYLLPYSTDIGAAWQVVEAMRARGYRYHVGDGARNQQAASFWRQQESFDTHTALAETAPEAICRAALAALAQEGGMDER